MQLTIPTLRPRVREKTSRAGIARASLVLAVLFLSACDRTPEAREATHLKRGKDYVAKKDYRRAAIEFKVAAQNMPKDAEPVYQLGMTYLRGNAGRLAAEAFQKAAALNPKHEGAQYQLALLKVGSSKQDSVQEGKEFLVEYLKGHTGDFESFGSLALADAKLGDKDGAIRMLDLAESKDPTNLRPAAQVIAVYAAKGDVETSREISRNLSEKLPNSPDAAILRAEVSLALRDTADTDAQISRALSLKRDFRPALELRLRREFMNGDQQGAAQTTQQLSALPEKRTWAAYARLLFTERKFDQGTAEFERVIKEHGDDNDLRDEYSAMLENYGRGKQASAVIAGTLKKNPKDASALLQRVKLELDAGDIEPAAKDAKALQDLKALSPQLTFDEARIAGARGESTRQGDLLAELLRSYPRFLAARLELSRLLVASGKGRNAVELLNLASPAEQRNADYVFYRNTALMSAGEWDEAKKSVAGALAVSHSPGFLYQDAVVRLRDRDLAGARKSIESAFQISPDAATLNLLGEVMRQQREFPAYVAMLKDAVAKSPQSAALQTALGSALTAQGDQKGARAAFEAAKTAGNTVDADFDLALLDMRNGALDQAKQRLLELVKGHDNARSRLLLAEIETRKGSPDMVIQHYLKAIELEPQNAMAMNNLADFLSTQKKFDDAVFWAKKALATAPNSPIAEDTIGWIYFRQAKYEDAMPFLEKSLKGLDRPVAHYHLAAALFRAGDPRRAKQEYEIGVKQNPGSHERDEVRPMFETR